MERTPIGAITTRDPASIGPKIAVKALAGVELNESCSPLVVSDTGVILRAAESLKSGARIRFLETLPSAEVGSEKINLLDLHNINLGELVHGKVSAMAGRAAYGYIERVICLALRGEVDAAVTAPIHKEAVNRAGFPYSGHTEIFAALTDSQRPVIVLSCGNFCVVHVSTMCH